MSERLSTSSDSHFFFCACSLKIYVSYDLFCIHYIKYVCVHTRRTNARTRAHTHARTRAHARARNWYLEGFRSLVRLARIVVIVVVHHIECAALAVGLGWVCQDVLHACRSSLASLHVHVAGSNRDAPCAQVVKCSTLVIWNDC